MPQIDERTEMLIGVDAKERLHQAKVAVFGLGGVGGTAFEALLRSGVGTIYAVDCDVVDETNLNRQLLFTKADIGKEKAVAAKERATAIRDDVNVCSENYRIDENSLSCHDYSECDCLIDAVDDVAAKIALIRYAAKIGKPILVSLGMGNRLNPSKVELRRLDKTEGDPLAKKVRYECRQNGIDMKNVWCAISTEEPLVRTNKPSSMMMVPSAAGLLLAYQAIEIVAKPHASDMLNE